MYQFVYTIKELCLSTQAVLLAMTTATYAVADDDVITPTSVDVCKDRFGPVDVTTFRRRSCVLCYYYLFPVGRDLRAVPPYYLYLARLNGTSRDRMIEMEPDNATVMAEVCDSLDTDGCRRLKTCCRTAIDCCQRQLQQPTSDAVGEDVQEEKEPSCISTWDGFSCWDRTPAGSYVRQTCPTYMERAISTRTSNLMYCDVM